MDSRPVLSVEGVTKVFRAQNRQTNQVEAVSDVSLSLREGEITALVGESGSGKTTIGRMIAGVEIPTAGKIETAASDRTPAGRTRRRAVQMVFQDPYAALNPFNTVAYSVSRPLVNYGHLSGDRTRAMAAELLATVQLTPPDEFLAKRPHELSGGQRQRVVVARALAAEPEIVVADEPVSMLDVSIRADILRLLKGLVDEGHVRAMLYITHDLLSARLIANRILVLYRGHLVESGDTDSVVLHPAHPYTQLLWSAIPNPRRGEEVRAAPRKALMEREGPSRGCPFASRCPLVIERCWEERPPLVPHGSDRTIACHVVAGKEPVPA